MGLLKPLSRKFSRLFSLPVKTYPLLVEAWLTLAWVDLVIRFVPYTRWRHWLESNANLSEIDQKELDISFIVACSEKVARHHYCAMNCLRRTVAQKVMLARRGVSAQVHIGVKKEAAGFAAHSWLTNQGRVLNDSEDVAERYVELERALWRSAKLFTEK